MLMNQEAMLTCKTLSMLQLQTALVTSGKHNIPISILQSTTINRLSVIITLTIQAELIRGSTPSVRANLKMLINISEKLSTSRNLMDKTKILLRWKGLCHKRFNVSKMIRLKSILKKMLESFRRNTTLSKKGKIIILIRLRSK